MSMLRNLRHPVCSLLFHQKFQRSNGHGHKDEDLTLQGMVHEETTMRLCVPFCKSLF